MCRILLVLMVGFTFIVPAIYAEEVSEKAAEVPLQNHLFL